MTMARMMAATATTTALFCSSLNVGHDTLCTNSS